MSHSDQFGDLRSLLQGQPNLERWSALCAHVYQHGHALDQAHWVYLREHLKRTGWIDAKSTEQTKQVDEMLEFTKKFQQVTHCPKCYSANVAFESGCSEPSCKDCGYSKCS